MPVTARTLVSLRAASAAANKQLREGAAEFARQITGQRNGEDSPRKRGSTQLTDYIHMILRDFIAVGGANGEWSGEFNFFEQLALAGTEMRVRAYESYLQDRYQQYATLLKDALTHFEQRHGRMIDLQREDAHGEIILTFRVKLPREDD
jgi:hypothetical protein